MAAPADENAAPLDIGDAGDEKQPLADRDFMAMAKAAIKDAGSGPVKVAITHTPGIVAMKEKEAKRVAVKQAIADQAGLVVDVSAEVALAEPQKKLSKDEQEEQDEADAQADAASEAAAAAERNGEKASIEQAAAKVAARERMVAETLKAAALAAKGAVEATEEKIKDVPLRFSSEKLGAGVSLGSDGKEASAGAQVAQLCNVWMPAGRKPLIWTVALSLDSVCDDTTIGVVGRNFWPAEWERSLETCNHAVVLRCGDGKVRFKGKGTSFVLRRLESGTKLSVTLDMQTLEMTIDVVGKEPGSILSSITIENIPSEVTLAVGFAKGAAQRVRVVGCTCEKPGLFLTGKLRKDLWDEDNVIEPLALDCLSARGPAKNQEEMTKVAASLGD